ncbi:MAG: 3-oxoacyl-ACP reductase [Alphaproteobacteria bacterium TMED87]|nr:3-oxoacyl-ACP reductase [Rhodospirillaceae bacterium]OUV09340.1 MAG: 3-oxoacyl-ACP reductase [Alphaproteobacteria bacterium TMED87]|tara:strand:+ start:568 stop:1323 length:756 start_codon:yes stop_codon:yes gene_type:complete
MSKLDGLTALITGSNRGIGAGVAKAFASLGANVIINYPDSSSEAEALELKKELEKNKVKSIIIEADVADSSAVKEMIKVSEGKFENIDILVNNAGIAAAAPVENIEVETWDRVIDVHLKGTFLTCKYVLPGMYKRGQGKIINTASQLAYLGAAGFAHYTAAKGAIVTFTRTLALEAAPKGINVNAVAPGATRTAMLQDVPDDILEGIRQAIPLGRLAEVDDIIPSYVFLASDESRHYIGQVISPNGGDMFL